MQDQEKLYEGTARGGPLDGQEVGSRFPKGFAYADPVDNRVWIYEWVEEEKLFRARNDEAMELDRDKLEKAAREASYDVRAYDDGSPPDEEVGL